MHYLDSLCAVYAYENRAPVDICIFPMLLNSLFYCFINVTILYFVLPLKGNPGGY